MLDKLNAQQIQAIEKLYDAVPGALQRDAEFQAALDSLHAAGLELGCSHLQLHFVRVENTQPAISAAEEAHGDAAFLRTLRIDPDLDARGEAKG